MRGGPVKWDKMRFRDQVVFVHVDAKGRPILDAEGRAEMKYRPDDAKSYRPAPVNLRPASADDRPAARGPGRGTGRGAKPPARTRRAPASGPAPEGAIAVWTDGACTGNPGPMGIGIVVLAGEERREAGEYLGIGTNNIAELVAIERGLEIAREVAGGEARPVLVYSDSAYSIGVLSLGWKAKANQALVERLRHLVGSFEDLSFVKVAGHAGVPENERCDELARQAILLGTAPARSPRGRP